MAASAASGDVAVRVAVASASIAAASTSTSTAAAAASTSTAAAPHRHARVAAAEHLLQHRLVDAAPGGQHERARERRHRRPRRLVGQVERAADDGDLVRPQGAAEALALGVQPDERLELRAAEERRVLAAEHRVEQAADRPRERRAERHERAHEPRARRADLVFGWAFGL